MPLGLDARNSSAALQVGQGERDEILGKQCSVVQGISADAGHWQWSSSAVARPRRPENGSRLQNCRAGISERGRRQRGEGYWLLIFQ